MSSASSSRSSLRLPATANKWVWLGAGAVAAGAAAAAAVAIYKRRAAAAAGAAAASQRTDAAPSSTAGAPATAAAAPAPDVHDLDGPYPSAVPTVDTGADPTRVIIGTRSSALALWQAHHVADLLRAKFPHITFDVLPMNTLGDIDQIKPLSDFASKGVFTKELDVATLTNTIQLAVHCLKDLPTTLPPGLYMGAVLERGDTEDVLVLPLSHPKHHKGSLDDLHDGAVVGTSAMRRSASIAKHYPKLVCKNIRGNVNTRLAKLDRGDYDAIILARVGLKRLGLSNRISAVLDTHKYGYAVGQGALAIVCRDNDPVTQRLVAALEDLPTRWATEAERGVLRTLNGGCKVPITIRTSLDNPSARYLEEHPSASADLVRTVHVWCSVMSLDGAVEKHASHSGTVDGSGAGGPDQALVKARQIGEELGDMLLKKGADKLLEGIVDKEGPGHRAPSAAAQSSH